MQQFELVVTKPFGDYQRGDRITDQSVISEILSGDHEHEQSVVRVAAPSKEY